MWQWYGYGPPYPWYGPRPWWWGATPAWPWAPIPKDEEIAMLEDEARGLEQELDAIRKRLAELKGEES